MGFVGKSAPFFIAHLKELSYLHRVTASFCYIVKMLSCEKASSFLAKKESRAARKESLIVH